MKKLFILFLIIFSHFSIFAQNFEGIISYKLGSYSKGFENDIQKKNNLNSTVFRYYFKYPYVIEELETSKGEKLVRTMHNEELQKTISYCKGTVCWDKKTDISKDNILPKNIKKLNDTIIQNTNVNVFLVTKNEQSAEQLFWIDKTKHQNIQFPIAQPFDADKEDFTLFNEYIKGLPLRIEIPIPLPKDIKEMLKSYSSSKNPKITSFLVFELKNIEEKKLDKKFFEQAKKAFSK